MVDGGGANKPITDETMGPGYDGRESLTVKKGSVAGGRGAPALQFWR